MSAQEDLLLRNLGEQARQDIEGQDGERFGARWDDYAAGRLSVEEAEALIAASEDPETQLAASLFKPIESELKASLVERLQEEVRPQAVSNFGASEGNLGEPETLSSPGAEASQVRPGFLVRIWNWLGNGSMFERKPSLGLAVGVMAALLFMVSWPLLRQDVEALPPFESSLQGIQELRSSTGEAGDTFRAGHRFNFLLRPKQKVEGPIVTTVVVQDFAGKAQRWKKAEAAVQRSSEGTVFTEGLTWPWGEGEWTVHFFVTRAPLGSDAIQRILLEQSPAGDFPQSKNPGGLEDGHWVRERIYVLP